MNVVTLFDLLKSYGPWGLLLAATWLLYALLKILIDEDRAAVFRAKFYKIAYSLTGRINQEKQYISNDIMGKLNLVRREMHFGNEILPRAIDVSWVEEASSTTQDVREGEFIIRLDPSKNQPENICRMAAAMVKRTTLSGIRHSIEPPLETAIDLNLVRELLKKVGNSEALDWFLANEYHPAVSADDATSSRNEQIVTIDERGLFTRLLLVELESFSREIYGRSPKPYMAGEIEGLVEFLYNLCSRKPQQDVPLKYHRAFIRIGVIIVAKTAKLLQSIEPYLEAMQINLEKESASIYVMVFEKEWLEETNPAAHAEFENRVSALERAMGQQTVAIKKGDYFYTYLDQSGKRRNARCIRYVAPPVR